MSAETPQRRSPWFLLGLVLWGAVFVTLFVRWKSIREQAAGRPATAVSSQDGAPSPATAGALAETSPSSGDSTSQSSDGSPANPDESPAETSPAIQITWSARGLPDFDFIDTQGRHVTKNDLLGQPWVASFIFTRCRGSCPRVTNSVDRLQRLYKGRPVRFVTFTVDPDHDTVDVLKHYAEQLDADPDRWLFLTGDRTRLYSLINRDFLMPARPAPDPEPGWEVIHTNNVCLVDATGRVVGKFNSVDDGEMMQLRHELDRLLQQTSSPGADGSAAPTQ